MNECPLCHQEVEQCERQALAHRFDLQSAADDAERAHADERFVWDEDDYLPDVEDN